MAGYSPGDAAWAVGSRAINPDRQTLVTRDGVDRAFEAAAVGAHLPVRIEDNTVHRTTVGIGLVALGQIEARCGRDLPVGPRSGQ